VAYAGSSQRIPHHSRIGGKCRLAEVLLERLKDLDERWSAIERRFDVERADG
jgi:hypothetical protein